MASPAPVGTVADTDTGAVNVTTLAITMPGSIAAGNGIAVKVSWDGAGDITVDTGASSAGWVKLGQTTNTTLCTTAWFWQPSAIGGGSDSLTVTTPSERGTAMAQRVTGHSTSITPDYGGQTGAAAADTANGPNVSVTGGSKDILVLTGMTADSATIVPTAAPTNYSSLATNVGAGGSVTSAWASRQLTASSEDPGAFTHSSVAWIGETIIIHPASSAISVDLTPVTETDTAQVLSFVKTIFKTLGEVSEADAAQAITQSKIVVLSAVSEADTAQAVSFTQESGTIFVTITPVDEAETAQALVAVKTIYKTLGVVAETDLAIALSLASDAPVVVVARAPIVIGRF